LNICWNDWPAREFTLLVRNFTAASFVLTVIAFNSTIAQGQDPFQGWYQIDAIFFKPKSTDLDEESWPEATPIYPADITAVTNGGVFKLSQLEQLAVLLPAATGDSAPELGTDDFAFEGQSRRNKNRRVIEYVTGSYEQDSNGDLIRASNIDSGNPSNQKISAEDLIHSAFERDRTTSEGALAFNSRKAESSLQTIMRSLQRSSLFTVLSHQSWTQPIGSKPTSVLIHAGQRHNDRFELEGTLSLTRSRFLHLKTNLWYNVFESRSGESKPSGAGFQSNLSTETLSLYPELLKVERERGQHFVARTHLMSQSRRMRSDELHHIDHPLFGVVVRINQFKPKND
jgi:hypothetical protein